MKSHISWQRHLTMALVLSSGCASAGSAAPLAASQRWEGDAISSQRPELRFRWRVERCGDRLRSEWRDAQGRLVAWDEVTGLGAGFGRYQLQRAAGSQDIHAANNGRDIVVERREAGRFVSRQHIVTAGESVLAGPMMVSLLQEHLPQLRAGREIVRSYLVPEQALVLRLIARQSRAGAGGSISVSIQAASPLLRPFVPTTVLEFDAQNRLLRSSGRILPSSAPAMLTTTHQPDSYPEVTCGF